MGVLDGKVALVTGGSRGIGRAISVALAKEGAAIGVNFLSDARAAGEAAAKVAEVGSRAAVVQADIADQEQVQVLYGEIERTLGPVDIVVANAGITRDGLAVRMSMEDWDNVIASNLRGAFLCSKAALRHMMKQRWGRVIFISSIAGITGNAGQANYSAAKAGLIGLARSLTRELASREITFNVVAPGFIDTAMTAGLDQQIRDTAVRRIPAGRFGTAEEVAAVVAFLATPAAAYINGAVIRVDGGISM